jgi:hypothetical protein
MLLRWETVKISSAVRDPFNKCLCLFCNGGQPNPLVLSVGGEGWEYVCAGLVAMQR